MGLCQVHNSFYASFFPLSIIVHVHSLFDFCKFQLHCRLLGHLNDALQRCITHIMLLYFCVFTIFKRNEGKNYNNTMQRNIHCMWQAIVWNRKKSLNKYNDIIFIVIYLTWIEEKKTNYRRSILAINLSINNQPYYRFLAAIFSLWICIWVYCIIFIC